MWPSVKSWKKFCAYILGQTRADVNSFEVLHRLVSPCHRPSLSIPISAACLHRRVSLITRQLWNAVVFGDMQRHIQAVLVQPITETKPSTCDTHRAAVTADGSWDPGLRPAASHAYLKNPLTICCTDRSYLSVVNTFWLCRWQMQTEEPMDLCRKQ